RRRDAARASPVVRARRRLGPAIDVRWSRPEAAGAHSRAESHGPVGQGSGLLRFGHGRGAASGGATGRRRPALGQSTSGGPARRPADTRAAERSGPARGATGALDADGGSTDARRSERGEPARRRPDGGG